MQEKGTYNVGLYLRLSKDDERNGESFSIGTQRAILTDYCETNGYTICKEYVDDGYSGRNFDRPGFRELLRDVESNLINMVVTKDLSRLGRDYIMTGYYSEIYFPNKGVRYIALSDNVDTLLGSNEIAPFKNILNDMYAQDISKKIKTAKLQHAKQGKFIGSQAPYGYRIDKENSRLVVDEKAAAVVRLIFHLAESGLGNIAIAKELKKREIYCPSYYKHLNGDLRFTRYPSIANSKPYEWCDTTVAQILKNRVYLGELISLKTETINYKTKKRVRNAEERQIVTLNAHEAIIRLEQFDAVQRLRSNHFCRANTRRENLFRGKLFCECCGHPLSLSKKQLKDREADIYFCMYHFHHPDVCPKTHRVYHEMLYPYVLQQIRSFAQTMKRRKINTSLKNMTNIEEITPEILDQVIERIEISHVSKKSKPHNVIHIYWKIQ